MNLISSLFSKILLCFLANLILVVLLLFGFIAFQTQVDLHSILGFKTSDRFRIAATIIAHDLNQGSREKWPEILTQYKEIYLVDFALVTSAGLVSVSQGLSVPEEVISRAMTAYPKDLGSKPLSPFSRSNRYNRFEKNLQNEQNNIQQAVSPNRHAKREFYNPNRGRRAEPRLIMHTKNPTRHWIGIWILSPMNEEGPLAPSMLLAGSDSITGNGFFFEPIPWIIAAAVVILISALLWIPLVRHITKPLGRMTRAAEEIAKGKFDVAVLEQRRDEIGRLSSAIDHMMSRLHGFVEGQKRFLRDVAHELGSPIARIQFGLGILEQHVDEKNSERLADVTEDVAHMSNLVNELLSFSRTELNPEKVKLEPVELLAVVQKAARREGMASEEMVIDINPSIKVMADPALLSRAISNLIRNAVKYGGHAGPICITARKEKNVVSIEIQDSGPGIPETLLDKIFEPFFRTETSRDRESGGVGLGLSIVKTCMDACGGTVNARNLEPQGFSVTLTLPYPTVTHS